MATIAQYQKHAEVHDASEVADEASGEDGASSRVQSGASDGDGWDTGGVKQSDTTPKPFVGYALRPVIVADDLRTLRGPLTGRWQLPLHLDSSGRTVFDFAVERDRLEAYQLVLLRAMWTSDVRQWLNCAELTRLWPELYLPRVVRAAWQAEHPTLALAGAGPHVPQL